MNPEKQHAPLLESLGDIQEGSFWPSATKMESVEETRATKMKILQQTYEDDRGFFWFERISFFVLVQYWVLHTILPSCLPGGYVKLWLLWSLIVSLGYLLTQIVRTSLHNQQERALKQQREEDQKLLRASTEVKEPMGHESQFCYGFWLERLAIIFLDYGIWLYVYHQDRRGELIMNGSFMTVFPLLNIYYACFGYYAEFERDLHQELQDGKPGITKEETEGKNVDNLSDSKEQVPSGQTKVNNAEFENIEENNDEEVNQPNGKEMEKMENGDNIDKDGGAFEKEADGEKDTEEADGAKDERNQQSELVSEAKKAISSPSSSANEDRFVRIDEMKLMINILEDNCQRKMQQSEYAWESKLEKLMEGAWDSKHKKVVEKYEEDYQKLKEQNEDLALKLSAANASCQLYRCLLHENVFSVI